MNILELRRQVNSIRTALEIKKDKVETLGKRKENLEKKISDLESTQKRIFKRLKRKLRAKVNGYE